MLLLSKSPNRLSGVYPYLLATGSVIAALVVRQLVDPVVGDRLPFGTFFIAVMAISWWTGVGPTLLALLLSSLIGIFLFMPPRYVFTFTTLSDFLGWLIFFMVGLASAVISEARRTAWRRAEAGSQASQALVGQLEAQVHQHHLTLEAFQNKETELKDFIENAITPIYQVDANGIVAEANQAELDLLGYSREEYVGHPITEFHVNREVIATLLEQLSRREVVRGYEAQLRARDGSIRHVLINASPFPVAGQGMHSRWFHHDITGRKAIEAIQSRLSAIVESSEDAIVSKTLNGIIVTWNTGAERIFGYTPGEAIGQSIRMLFPPERMQEEDEFLQKLSRGEAIRHFETVRVRKDGQRIDISVTLSPVRDAEGNITGISKIARDITERKREEQRRHLLLELSAAFSRALFPEEIAEVIVQRGLKSLDARVGAVGLLVEQGTVLELVSSSGLSERSTRQYHQTPLDFSGPLNDAVRNDQMIWIESADAYLGRYPHLKAAIQQHGTQSVIALPLKINEKILGGFSLSFPYEKSPTAAEETFFTTLAYLCAQALERVRLNTLLEAEHQRLANILATVPGIIWENEHLDEQDEMKLVFISGYVETMLGYTVQEALAEPHFWSKIFHPEDAYKTIEAFYRVRRSGGSGVVNFRAIHKTGRIIDVQALMVTIMKDRHPVGKRGVMMDVTERQRLMDAQTRYAEMLRRSNDELEQFARVAAHDLQEPLRMVSSYMQLLESRYAEQLDDNAREFIGFAVDGALRMKTLITALLAYSRLQGDETPFQDVSLEKLLDRVLASLTVEIEQTHARITRDTLPDVKGDPVQLTQLFQNLISNALKFQQDNVPDIHIGVAQKNRLREFYVRDNGIGIPADALDRIFVIFKRLHLREEYPGTGIGLAICKKVVERHGGQIRVESMPGQGTTFYFTLPVTQRV